MRSRGYASKRDRGSPLRTGHAHQHVFRRDEADFLLRHERSISPRCIRARYRRYATAIGRPAWGDARFHRRLIDRRDAGNIAGKARNGHTAFAVVDDVDQAFESNAASDPASPSTNTLVESHTSASTPSSPRSQASSSVTRPISGSGSIFQSVACTTCPHPFGWQEYWLPARNGPPVQVNCKKANIDAACDRNFSQVDLIEQIAVFQFAPKQPQAKGVA